MAYVKLVTLVILALTGLRQLFTLELYWFIDGVNLIFHEAGHVFLYPFGNLLYALGGTIFEIGIPTVVMAYFFKRKNQIGAAFAGWWGMTAALSVSIYAADALKLQLPLITGDVATHDWNFILNTLGLLQYTDLIAFGFWLLGAVFLSLGIFVGLHDRAVWGVLRNNVGS